MGAPEVRHDGTDDVHIFDKVSTDKLTVASTIDVSDVEANASQTITISNVGAAGIGTATIAKWLKVTQGGTVYYIPMWT